MTSHRIFVEKLPLHQSEAKNYLHEIQHILQINAVHEVRHAIIYELFGIEDKELEHVAPQIFYEPPRTRIFYSLEDLCVAQISLTNGGESTETMPQLIAMEYVSGQYDQRSDSAEQCLGLLGFEQVSVRTGQVLLLYGALSESKYEQIKHYCINPIEMCEKDLTLTPKLPAHTQSAYKDTHVENFIELDKIKIETLRNSLGLSMSFDDIVCVQEYFKTEKRNPTLTEIRILDTYWSDHCRHTTFLTQFEEVIVNSDGAEKRGFELYQHIRNKLQWEKPMTLMDIATIGAKYLQAEGYAQNIDKSDEINACSMHTKVKFYDGHEEDWLFMFKNETHNHPTEIEPYGGAATCLGGAIRDPLSGRSYVFGAMRVSGSADPRELIKDTLAHKLPQRYITQHAARGFSSYGNQVGLATPFVKEIYHQGYRAKRLEAGFVMGAAPLSSVKRSQPEPGDVILLVGGKTGRDGIGGAVGSSKTHTQESLTESFAEVQKGNPIEAHALQRLFRNPRASKLIKRCNDFGAGGVSVAVGELADGVDIELDKIPLKYLGLDGTELATSESQERMAVVLSEAHKDIFIELANLENVEATHIATVTEEARVIMRWREHEIVNIARSFLNTNGASRSVKVELNHETQESSKSKKNQQSTKISKEHILKKMEDLNLVSQHGLQSQFDSSIGAGTVFMPYGGYKQESPSEGVAMLMPTTYSSDMCRTVSLSAMSCPIYLLEQSPYRGASYAVVESLAKIVAMGGNLQNAKLSFQEFFQKLEKDPSLWSNPSTALLGALEAQIRTKVPAIGGKDSMSGSFENLHVPPTFISFAVSITDIETVKSTEIKSSKHHIYLLPAKSLADGTPDYEKLLKTWTWLQKNLHRMQSAISVNEGGIFVALVKKALGNNIGMNIELPRDFLTTDFLQEINLHNTYRGSLIFSSADKIGYTSDVGDLLYLGQSTEEPIIHINIPDARNKESLIITLDEIRIHNKYVFHDIFPTIEDKREMEIFFSKELDAVQTKGRIESPQVAFKYTKFNEYIEHINDVNVIGRVPQICIPIFPGTNCEYDTSAIFEYLGAECAMPVFLNSTQQHIVRSIDTLTEEIADSQIFVLAGGFSLGDQPGGSGKYIASVLRHPKIVDALYQLLYRNGLILGICNGFQALIKSGWLPYGKPSVQETHCPTLSDNITGLHISRIAQVKIMNNRSPWLSAWNVGDEMLLPVSHGEGRFFVNDVQAIETQIATCYAGEDENPNGSLHNIEGMISKDGHIFGRMGHAERMNRGVLQNIPYHQKGDSQFQKNSSIYQSLIMFKSGLEFVW